MRALTLCALVSFAPTLQASLGFFEHGAGIKAQGAGGINHAFGEEATALAFNPAIAAALEDRNELGSSVIAPKAEGEFVGDGEVNTAFSVLSGGVSIGWGFGD